MFLRSLLKPLVGLKLFEKGDLTTIPNYFMLYGILKVSISSFANSSLLFFPRDLPFYLDFELLDEYLL